MQKMFAAGLRREVKRLVIDFENLSLLLASVGVSSSPQTISLSFSLAGWLLLPMIHIPSWMATSLPRKSKKQRRKEQRRSIQVCKIPVDHSFFLVSISKMFECVCFPLTWLGRMLNQQVFSGSPNSPICQWNVLPSLSLWSVWTTWRPQLLSNCPARVWA